MKFRIFIIAIVIVFGLTSCRGRSSNNQTHSHENCTEHNHNHNTHTHADGTVHSDHAPEHKTPQQESFKVEADSSTVNTNTVKHNHGHDKHDHQH